MRDNGERIYRGLIEAEDMQKLEEENTSPQETDFCLERTGRELPDMIGELLSGDKSR